MAAISAVCPVRTLTFASAQLGAYSPIRSFSAWAAANVSRDLSDWLCTIGHSKLAQFPTLDVGQGPDRCIIRRTFDLLRTPFRLLL